MKNGKEYIIEAGIIAKKLGISEDIVKQWFKDGILYEDAPGNNSVITAQTDNMTPGKIAFEVGLYLELTLKEAHEREIVRYYEPATGNTYLPGDNEPQAEKSNIIKFKKETGRA